MKGHMPHRIICVVAVVVALMLMAGVAASAPGPFTMADSGSMVAIKKGETFMVVLPENPSTGYSWNMTVSDGLKVMDDRYIPPAQQVPGRGGQHEWTIKAVKPGQQKVRGIYMRPWEPIYYNETTFRLDVEVTGSPASSLFPDLSGNAFGIRNIIGDLGSLDFLPSLRFDIKDLFRL
jgi:inhibitor of cysteine peptidase